MAYILYADERNDFAHQIKEVLESSGHFQVDTATSEPEVLEKLSDHSFSALILGFGSNNIDLNTFIVNVREEMPEIPIIIFAEPGEENAVIAAMNNGADYYARKGSDLKLSANELLKSVETAIKRQNVISRETDAEAKISHQNRVLRAIKDVNQLIIKENNPYRLLRDTCNTLIKTRGYLSACTAYFDISEKYATIIGANQGSGCIMVSERTGSDNLPGCMKKARRKEKIVITEEPTTECPDCPFLQSYGFYGGMTTRLEYGGKIYGILSTSVPRNFLKDEEEQALFREVAADIAYALHSIQLGKENRLIEAKLRMTQYSVDHSSEEIFWINSRGSYLNVNKQACRVLGYSHSELMKMHVFDVDVSGNPEKWSDMWNALKTDGEYVVESVYRKKCGTLFPVEINMNYLVHCGQEFACAFVRDVTERKKVINALKTSEERFRQVTENAEECIWEVDTDGTFTYISPFIETIFVYRPRELVGKMHFYDLFHPDVRDGLKDLYLRAFDRRIPIKKIINKNLSKDGNTIWLLTSAIPFFDMDGSLLGYRGVASDITANVNVRKREHLALSRVEDNLRQFATLNDQIRNPLAVIVGLADLYGGDSADKIISQADIINEIIKNLDLGWVESDKIRTFLRKHYDFEESNTEYSGVEPV